MDCTDICSFLSVVKANARIILLYTWIMNFLGKKQEPFSVRNCVFHYSVPLFFGGEGGGGGFQAMEDSIVRYNTTVESCKIPQTAVEHLTHTRCRKVVEEKSEIIQ